MTWKQMQWMKVMLGGLFLVLSFVLVGSPAVEAQRVATPVTCSSSAVINTALAATAQLAALSGTRKIVVCNFTLTGGGATTYKLVYGTGSNCVTGTTDVTGAFELGDNTSVPVVGPLVLPAGKALCGTNSAAVQVSGVLTWGYTS